MAPEPSEPGQDRPAGRPRARWWRPLLAVLVGLSVLVGVVLLIWLAPPAFYGYVKEPKDRAAVEASTRTGLIAGLAGLATLDGLVFTARNVQINRQTSEATQQAQTETLRLTEQGHITEHYTKAIEQLGNKGSLDVRLDGIYALERITVDSIRDHPTVVEVLSAFIREHSRPTTSRMLLPIERSHMQTAEHPPAKSS